MENIINDLVHLSMLTGGKHTRGGEDLRIRLTVEINIRLYIDDTSIKKILLHKEFLVFFSSYKLMEKEQVPNMKIFIL